jgi:hypothetical protein
VALAPRELGVAASLCSGRRMINRLGNVREKDIVHSPDQTVNISFGPTWTGSIWDMPWCIVRGEKLLELEKCCFALIKIKAEHAPLRLSTGNLVLFQERRENSKNNSVVVDGARVDPAYPTAGSWRVDSWCRVGRLMRKAMVRGRR